MTEQRLGANARQLKGGVRATAAHNFRRQSFADSTHQIEAERTSKMLALRLPELSAAQISFISWVITDRRIRQDAAVRQWWVPCWLDRT